MPRHGAPTWKSKDGIAADQGGERAVNAHPRHWFGRRGRPFSSSVFEKGRPRQRFAQNDHAATTEAVLSPCKQDGDTAMPVKCAHQPSSASGWIWPQITSAQYTEDRRRCDRAAEREAADAGGSTRCSPVRSVQHAGPLSLVARAVKVNE